MPNDGFVLDWVDVEFVTGFFYFSHFIFKRHCCCPAVCEDDGHLARGSSHINIQLCVCVRVCSYASTCICPHTYKGGNAVCVWWVRGVATFRGFAVII